MNTIQLIEAAALIILASGLIGLGRALRRHQPRNNHNIRHCGEQWNTPDRYIHYPPHPVMGHDEMFERIERRLREADTRENVSAGRDVL